MSKLKSKDWGHYIWWQTFSSCFYRATACNTTHGRAKCPSVCPSICQTKETSARILIRHEDYSS